MSSLTVMVSLELGAPDATVLPGGGTCATLVPGGAPGGTACPTMLLEGTNGGLGMDPLSVVIGGLIPACPGCKGRPCCLTAIWPGTDTGGGAGGAPGKGGRVVTDVSLDIPEGI